MIDFDIDEVPGRRFAVAVPIFVIPGCSAGEIRGCEIVSVDGQERVNPGSGFWGQALVGDQGRDLGAKLAPGLRRDRRWREWWSRRRRR